MWIVDRGQVKGVVALAGELEKEASRLIKAHYATANGLQGSLCERDERSLQELLGQLHKEGKWLGCDCQEQPNTPIIFVVLLRRGRYVLRRTLEYAEHHSTCPLHYDKEVDGGATRLLSTQRFSPKGVKPPSFLLYRSKPKTVGRGVPGGSKASPPPDDPSVLRRRLEWLVAHAGYRYLYPTTEVGVTMAGLRLSAQSIPLAQGIMLGDVLWTHDEWLLKGWCNRDAERLLQQKDWPSDLPLQGFLAVSVKSVEGRVIETKNGKIPVSGRIEQLATKAPMMALISLRRGVGDEAFSAISACVVSRLQRSWIPLGTDADRDAADLLRWVAEKQKEKGRDLLIERKWGCYLDEPAPDFVVCAPNRELAVVLEGGDENEKARRYAVVSDMTKRNIEFVRYNPDAEDRKQEVKRVLKEIFEWCEQ